MTPNALRTLDLIAAAFALSSFAFIACQDPTLDLGRVAPLATDDADGTTDSVSDSGTDSETASGSESEKGTGGETVTDEDSDETGDEEDSDEESDKKDNQRSKEADRESPTGTD